MIDKHPILVMLFFYSRTAWWIFYVEIKTIVLDYTLLVESNRLFKVMTAILTATKSRNSIDINC